MEKTIYVTQRIDFIHNRNEIRDIIDQNLILFLQRLGFIPVTIPNYSLNIKDSINAIFKNNPPHGIVFSGGNNIGEYNNRDNLERHLIELSIKSNIPLVGICRGMQIINDYFGGKCEKIKNHVNVSHNVTNSDGIKFMVNSYHDYGIKKIPNCLIPLYHCDDGTIEGINHVEKNIYGIMWHPEREKKFNEFDINFFKKIFNS